MLVHLSWVMSGQLIQSISIVGHLVCKQLLIEFRSDVLQLNDESDEDEASEDEDDATLPKPAVVVAAAALALSSCSTWTERSSSPTRRCGPQRPPLRRKRRRKRKSLKIWRSWASSSYELCLYFTPPYLFTKKKMKNLNNTKLFHDMPKARMYFWTVLEDALIFK